MATFNEDAALYVVPTPIGNLGDITLRSLEVLRYVDRILAEDTRTTGVLLKHYEIKKPLSSYHSFNEHQTVTQIINKLENGERMALVSDAGTPAISDPGFLLIRACLEKELSIEVLPGPTAFVPALLKSGFPIDRFAFEGFLPHKKGKKTKLEMLAVEARTTVFYESPHRVLKTLIMMTEIMGGERRVSVSRELTKRHEETITGTLEEVVAQLEEKTVKGEIVVVLEGHNLKKNGS